LAVEYGRAKEDIVRLVRELGFESKALIRVAGDHAEEYPALIEDGKFANRTHYFSSTHGLTVPASAMIAGANAFPATRARLHKVFLAILPAARASRGVGCQRVRLVSHKKLKPSRISNAFAVGNYGVRNVVQRQSKLCCLIHNDTFSPLSNEAGTYPFQLCRSRFSSM